MAAPVDPVVARLIARDGSVTVPASVAGDVLRALVRDLTARLRTDGGEASPAVRQLLYALHTASQQHTSPTPAPSSADGTPPTPPANVELTAHQAALLLECSPEYARRLARTGRLVARRARTIWLINPESLDSYRKGRPPCPTPSPPPEPKPTPP